MKIQKYTKDEANKYKVLIDDEEYVLYDDVIVKYGLIMKSDIDSKTLKEVLKENEELASYYMSIKYITKKLRSEKEIYEYLSKKGINENVINNTIKKLKENNFLNNALYLKAYINDQINLTNNGPKKIVNSLIKLGFSLEEIDEHITKIDSNIWNEKIEKYVSKKISTNHNSSSRVLKMKISNDLINLGYDKEDIISIVNKYDIIDEDIYKKEYQKIKKQLSKKYDGYELEQKIKEKLYRKGFNISSYKESMYEE